MSKKRIGLLCLIAMFAAFVILSVTTTSTVAMAEVTAGQSPTSQLEKIQKISEEVPDLIKSDVAPLGDESKDATTRENRVLLLQSELYGDYNNKIYRYDPVVDSASNTSSSPSVGLGTQIRNGGYQAGVAFDPMDIIIFSL